MNYNQDNKIRCTLFDLKYWCFFVIVACENHNKFKCSSANTTAELQTLLKYWKSRKQTEDQSSPSCLCEWSAISWLNPEIEQMGKSGNALSGNSGRALKSQPLVNAGFLVGIRWVESYLECYICMTLWTQCDIWDRIRPRGFQRVNLTVSDKIVILYFNKTTWGNVS